MNDDSLSKAVMTRDLDALSKNYILSIKPVYNDVVKVISQVPLLKQVNDDLIIHGFTAAKIGGYHTNLKAHGHNGIPLVCVLSRIDWDLIHNLLIERITEIGVTHDEYDAVYRLILKVHQQRHWINTITGYTDS